MSEECIFPLCKRIPEKNGYCFLHKIYSGSTTSEFTADKRPVVKKKKPIPKQSQKRKKVQREYRKIVSEMNKYDDSCQIKSPVCTGKAQGANHKQKRSPKNMLDKKNLERSCNACNQFVETHVEWAKENGHSVSRFKK